MLPYFQRGPSAGLGGVIKLSNEGRGDAGYPLFYNDILTLIDSLQQEMPDKETILRICKLHKAWSIMAPWENVEDFVMTNWNSENIV